MVLKCCTQYISKFRKPSNGHRTRKGKCSSKFQRRIVLKDVQTTGRSLSMLVRLCSKSFKQGFSSTWIKNFQMNKQGFEKAVEPEIKLPTSVGSQRNQGNSRKTSTAASLTTRKSLTVWIGTNSWKFLKRWKYQTILPPSWATSQVLLICCRSRSNI